MKLSDAKIGTIVRFHVAVGHIMGIGKDNNGDYLPIVQFAASPTDTATAHRQGVLPKFTVLPICLKDLEVFVD